MTSIHIDTLSGKLPCLISSMCRVDRPYTRFPLFHHLFPDWECLLLSRPMTLHRQHGKGQAEHFEKANMGNGRQAVISVLAFIALLVLFRPYSLSLTPPSLNLTLPTWILWQRDIGNLREQSVFSLYGINHTEDKHLCPEPLQVFSFSVQSHKFVTVLSPFVENKTISHLEFLLC